MNTKWIYLFIAVGNTAGYFSDSTYSWLVPVWFILAVYGWFMFITTAYINKE